MTVGMPEFGVGAGINVDIEAKKKGGEKNRVQGKKGWGGGERGEGG